MGLDIYSNADYMLQLGAPVSLYPNIEIYELHALVKLHHELNVIVKKMMFSDGYREKRYLNGFERYYKLYLSNGFRSVLVYMVNHVISQARKESRSYDYFVKEVRIKERELLNRYEAYRKDICVCKDLAKKIDAGKHLVLGRYVNYFNGFSIQFNKLKRPLVAIYDLNKRCFDFLCPYHYNSKNDALLFAIEKVSHRSPYQIDVSFCVEFASFLFALYVYIEGKKRGKYDIYNKEKNIVKDIINQVNDISQFNFTRDIDSLKSLFLRKYLSDLMNKVNDEFIKSLKSNSLGIADIQLL